MITEMSAKIEKSDMINTLQGEKIENTFHNVSSAISHQQIFPTRDLNTI